MRIREDEIKLIRINMQKLSSEYNKSVNPSNSYYNNTNTDYSGLPIVEVVSFSGNNNRFPAWKYNYSNFVFITPDELEKDNDIKSFYNSLNKTDIDIKVEDKIYFSKSSQYPRHRLSNYTENKRTISKDNADWIVVPNNGFGFDTKEDCIFHKDKKTGDVYSIGDGLISWNSGKLIEFLYNNYANFSFDKNTMTKEDFITRYIGKHMNLDLEEIKFYKFLIDSQMFQKEDFLDLYDNYREKIITERQLDSYINSGDTTITLDEEKFNMINNLLKSQDRTNVSLGLRMMSSVDSDTSLIPLALLLLFNIQNVTYNKEWNTVGVKVLRERLSFINKYSIHGIKSQINILNKLTKEFVKTEEDRETIRKYGMPMIKAVVDNFINTELQGVDFINKYNLTLE